MKLKPVRFIGHKIGPFEHIELNWEQDSRYTLIVGENGMGKTTLVTAIAACLAGADRLFPSQLFDRLGQWGLCQCLSGDRQSSQSGVCRQGDVEAH